MDAALVHFLLLCLRYFVSVDVCVYVQNVQQEHETAILPWHELEKKKFDSLSFSRRDGRYIEEEMWEEWLQQRERGESSSHYGYHLHH